MTRTRVATVATIVVIALSGCTNVSDVLTPVSEACSLAPVLFGGTTADERAGLADLAPLVPTELVSDVKTVSGPAPSPAGSDDWRSSLDRLQQWAVVTCGAGVSFAEITTEASTLDRYRTVILTGSATTTVQVLGVGSVDGGLRLCAEALLVWPGAVIDTYDDFDVQLTSTVNGRCTQFVRR